LATKPFLSSHFCRPPMWLACTPLLNTFLRSRGIFLACRAYAEVYVAGVFLVLLLHSSAGPAAVMLQLMSDMLR
jgi:hypothetical protein